MPRHCARTLTNMAEATLPRQAPRDYHAPRDAPVKWAGGDVDGVLNVAHWRADEMRAPVIYDPGAGTADADAAAFEGAPDAAVVDAPVALPPPPPKPDVAYDPLNPYGQWVHSLLAGYIMLLESKRAGAGGRVAAAED